MRDDIPLSAHARKAPYHYGWDWGPRYVTSGIWRPVYFVAWDKAQLRDVWIKQQQLTTASAQLTARVKLDVQQAGQYKIAVYSQSGAFSTKTFNAQLTAGATENRHCLYHSQTQALVAQRAGGTTSLPRFRSRDPWQGYRTENAAQDRAENHRSDQRGG